MDCALCEYSGSYTMIETIINEVEPYSKFLEGPFPIKTTIQMCKACSTIRREPLYKENEMGKLYSSYLVNKAEDDSLEEHRIRGNRIFNLLSSIYKSARPNEQGLKVLDVGGNRGEFLDRFINAGYEAYVIDLSPARPVSSSIKKFEISFLQFQGPIHFDIIIMSHVLEHLPDPLVFLNHAYKLLNIHGIIYVEVPFEIHIPVIRSQGDFRHLYFFTKYNLKRFLMKSGLSVLKCYMAYEPIANRKIPVVRAIGMRNKESSDVKPISFCCSKLFLMLEMINPLPWFYRVINKLNQRTQI